jgi:hypothetical protein
MYNLELTKEELDFIYERCSRKAARLEESHLDDVPCFRIAWQIMTKIFDCRKYGTSVLPATELLAEAEKLNKET